MSMDAQGLMIGLASQPAIEDSFTRDLWIAKKFVRLPHSVSHRKIAHSVLPCGRESKADGE